MFTDSDVGFFLLSGVCEIEGEIKRDFSEGESPFTQNGGRLYSL